MSSSNRSGASALVTRFAVAALALAGAVPALGQPRYEAVQTAQNLTGARAYRITNVRALAGDCRPQDASYPQPYVMRRFHDIPGPAELLPVGDGLGGTATGINRYDEVSGLTWTIDGPRPVRCYFDQAGMWRREDLPLPVGFTDGDAVDINDDGMIIGNGYNATTFRAVRWDGSGPPVDLGSLGGPATSATDINNSGIIVGDSDTPDGRYRAFIYTDRAGMLALPTLPGVSVSRATSINEAGGIVGWAAFGGSGGAASWSDGKMEFLPLPSGAIFSRATGINDWDIKVGFVVLNGIGQRACAWDANNQYIDLGAATSGLPAGTILTEAVGISNQGEIAVNGAIPGTGATMFVLQPACLGDLNGDGFVDGIDYDQFNNAFENTNPREQAAADINGDGYVDGLDSDSFNNVFESSCR